MKKNFLLQICYVVFSIALLSLFWQFVLEGFFSMDEHEDTIEKFDDVLTTIIITILALVYPTYKGLSLIQNWKELEKTLVDQGLQLEGIDNEKIDSLDSIKSILTDELDRRKKIEDEIKEERQNFHNMLDELPICFHLQADDYTVPFANKMFRERFGSPDSGLCYQLMHKRTEPCEACPTFKVFDTQEMSSSIWTAPDGRSYMAAVSPFQESSGNSLLMEMAIDITREQQAKDELKTVLNEQEERIKLRTLELERSNNSLKEFSSFAAHDLKEPVRKIMVFSDRIKEVMGENPGEETQRYLEGMQRSALRMNSLINDLLQFSEVSFQENSFQKVNLNRIVSEVIDDLEPSYPNAKNNISVQWLPTLLADKTQMYQLFINLISNSLKYTKVGESPRILIEVELDSAKNCLISIRDHGIGFDEKYKEKIFKPFERLHDRREYSGTGIGLAICKKVVECHTGELEVQSQLNEGTTFTISLPKDRNNS